MTPEEEKRINDRFERIEANLDRMAEESAKAQASLEARMAEHEARHAEHEARHAEHEARHAEERASLMLRQQQWEARWDRIERGIQYLVDTLGKHMSNGHGSEKEK